jgi:hypothetical protein
MFRECYIKGDCKTKTIGENGVNASAKTKQITYLWWFDSTYIKAVQVTIIRCS